MKWLAQLVAAAVVLTTPLAASAQSLTEAQARAVIAPWYSLFNRNSSRFPVWRVTGLAVHRGRTFRRGHDGRSDSTASQRRSPSRAR